MVFFSREKQQNGTWEYAKGSLSYVLTLELERTQS